MVFNQSSFENSLLKFSFYKVHKRSAISSLVRSGSGDVGLRRILTLILYLNLKRVMMQQKELTAQVRQLFSSHVSLTFPLEMHIMKMDRRRHPSGAAGT